MKRQIFVREQDNAKVVEHRTLGTKGLCRLLPGRSGPCGNSRSVNVPECAGATENPTDLLASFLNMASGDPLELVNVLLTIGALALLVSSEARAYVQPNSHPSPPTWESQPQAPTMHSPAVESPTPPMTIPWKKFEQAISWESISAGTHGREASRGLR